jgi:DNA adenine methylase
MKFTAHIRLQNVQIECTDALRIITPRDSANSFFYCDPPYFNSDCGHYDGYSLDDFRSLLDILSKIQGKFLLSSYPSPILSEFTSKFGWSTCTVDFMVSVNMGSGKSKTEVLTANYNLNKKART